MNEEKPYRPKGKVKTLLAALVAEPSREFTSKECAEIMGIESRKVSATLVYAEMAGIMVCRHEGRGRFWKAGEAKKRAKQEPRNPMALKAAPPKEWVHDPADPRIMRVVPGWMPPQMRCVRLGE